MFLQSYWTARDNLLYKDGFVLKFLLNICWLMKIHRACKRAKENLNGKYEIKNPYSGNFRQLFIPFFCQLVLDFKQLLHTLREWIKQNKWVRENYVLQLLVRFSKVTRVPFIFNLC